VAENARAGQLAALQQGKEFSRHLNVKLYKLNLGLTEICEIKGQKSHLDGLDHFDEFIVGGSSVECH